MITISCPECGHQQSVPYVVVPQHVVRAVCPVCGVRFPFRKETRGDEGSFSFTPVQGEESPGAKRSTLSPVGALLSIGWREYLQRAGVLIPVYLLAIVVMLIPAVVGGVGAALMGVYEGAAMASAEGPPDFVLLAGFAILMLVLFTISMTYGLGFFMAALVDPKATIGSAFSRGSSIAWPLLWSGGIFGFLVSGGLFLFVIPGLLFQVMFLFWNFIVARNLGRGLGALAISKRYVAGFGLQVFGRVFVLGLISAAVSLVPIVGFLISLFLFPYFMICQNRMLDELIEIKGDAPLQGGATGMTGFIIAAALGFVLLGGMTGFLLVQKLSDIGGL